MENLIENVSVKNHPKTTIPGHILMFIATLMVVVKYILPSFMVLKQPVEYHWGVIVGVGVAGFILLWMNDQWAERLFSRGDKYIGKVTGTDKNE